MTKNEFGTSEHPSMVGRRGSLGIVARILTVAVGLFLLLWGSVAIAEGQGVADVIMGVLVAAASLFAIPAIARKAALRFPIVSRSYGPVIAMAAVSMVGLVCFSIGVGLEKRFDPKAAAAREARVATLAREREEADQSHETERRNAQQHKEAAQKQLSREETLAQAREALTNGQPERALTIVFDNAPAELLRNDAEVKTLVAAIEDRMKANDASALNSEFAEKVRTYWLPQVNGIATTSPATAADIWNTVAKLVGAARALEDSNAALLDANGKNAQRDLRTAIAAKQRALFPILRGAYGKIVGQAMWERDIDIRVGGAGNRNITWTGGLFAARANIASGQGETQPHLLKLRFSRSTYEWAKGIGERYTYTMKVPADDAVGYWDGSVFKPVR